MKTHEQMKLLFEGWNRFINEQEDKIDPKAQEVLGTINKYFNFSKSGDFEEIKNQQLEIIKDTIALGEENEEGEKQKKTGSKEIPIPLENIIITINTTREVGGEQGQGVSTEQEKGTSGKSVGSEEIFEKNPDATSYEIFDNNPVNLATVIKGLSRKKLQPSAEFRDILKKQAELKAAGREKSSEFAKLSSQRRQMEQEAVQSMNIKTFKVLDSGQREEFQAPTSSKSGKSVTGKLSPMFAWQKLRNDFIREFITGKLSKNVNFKAFLEKEQEFVREYPLVAELFNDIVQGSGAKKLTTLDSVKAGDTFKRAESVDEQNKVVMDTAAQMRQAAPFLKDPVNNEVIAGKTASSTGESKKIKIFDFDGTLVKTVSVLPSGTILFYSTILNEEYKKIALDHLKKSRRITKLGSRFKEAVKEGRADPKNAYIISNISSPGIDRKPEYIYYLLAKNDYKLKLLLVSILGFDEETYNSMQQVAQTIRIPGTQKYEKRAELKQEPDEQPASSDKEIAGHIARGDYAAADDAEADRYAYDENRPPAPPEPTVEDILNSQNPGGNKTFKVYKDWVMKYGSQDEREAWTDKMSNTFGQELGDDDVRESRRLTKKVLKESVRGMRLVFGKR